MFQSPSKQANAAAQASQGLSDHTLAQIKQYTDQSATNEQNAIGNMPNNPYFTAGSLMNPSAYKINPAATTTFGEQASPGLMTGQGFQFSNPIPPAALNTPGTATTQPVAQSANAQSSQTAQPPVQPTNHNPFSNGKQNTAIIEALLGGGRT